MRLQVPENFKIGSIYDTNKSGKIEIIGYEKNTKVLVRFLNTGFEKMTSTTQIKLGEVLDNSLVTKEGDRFETNYSGWVTVLEYVSAHDVKVKFETTGYETSVSLGKPR